MNTDKLAKHYDKLTAWERLPLLQAAFKRGDQVETGRLARSAPTHLAQVPHHFGLFEGLAMLSVFHLLLQLERVWIITTVSSMVKAGQMKGEAVGDEVIKKWRMAAFQFVVAADAWKLLCDELHIEPESMIYYLPGIDLVRDMLETVRELAFTPEEALVYLRSRHEASEASGEKPAGVHREYRIETAAEVAQCLREFVNNRAKPWL